jgi:hypothetical protein
MALASLVRDKPYFLAMVSSARSSPACMCTIAAPEVLARPFPSKNFGESLWLALADSSVIVGKGRAIDVVGDAADLRFCLR